MTARVEVYTRQWCGYCTAAKRFLDKRGVRYTEIDCTGDADKRRWLAQASGRTTVPQIFIDDRPIGRFYVQRRTEEIRIIDIAFLPSYRKMGIGSSLLTQILDEAARNHLPVTIHVERFNPALHLYERLGFRLAEDRGVHYFMTWLPPQWEMNEDTRTVAEQ